VKPVVVAPKEGPKVRVTKVPVETFDIDIDDLMMEHEQ